jgi:sigma-54 specific flagellar transcriptional regulator A
MSLLCDGDVIQREDLRDFMTLEPAPAAAKPTAPTPHAEAASEATSVPDEANPDEPDGSAYDVLVTEGLSLHDYKKRIEQECIERALRQTNGNITRAAKLLKMKRPRLSQLVKEYGLTS